MNAKVEPLVESRQYWAIMRSRYVLKRGRPLTKGLVHRVAKQIREIIKAGSR